MNDGLSRQNMDIRLLLAGGKSSFMDYFTAGHPHAAVCASLKKNIRFVHHNLVSDGSFGEMDLILCRNVMIYFNRDLQNRVFSPVPGQSPRCRISLSGRQGKSAVFDMFRRF
jgi:hypothetical protein